MEPYTIQILSQYKSNVKFMNISNKNIVGLLDLSNYKKIKYLNCSNNQ